MTKAFSHDRVADGKEEWLTPPEIIRSLGDFDLDPCAPINRPWPTANDHYTIEDDGLKKEWDGRIWLNPPYGDKARIWMRRMRDHNNGIALIFARTETSTWFESIWDKAHSILFIRGRLAFYHVTGEKAKNSGGAPSALIAYGAVNTLALERCKIDGKLIRLK